MLRFGSVRLALPAVSFDDVPVGTVRFGATHLPPTPRWWEVGGGWEVGVGGGEVGGGRWEGFGSVW